MVPSKELSKQSLKNPKRNRKNRKTKIEYVEAHAGIHGNEMAE
jgi:hypothetical protein